VGGLTPEVNVNYLFAIRIQISLSLTLPLPNLNHLKEKAKHARDLCEMEANKYL
jgi:hypothetical protein